MAKINRREFLDRSKQAGIGLAGLTLLGNEQSALGATGKVFRAGAYAMDITPTWFPVVVNGHFQPRYAKKAEDPLHARCLVLDDGAMQIAIVQIDSCVIPRVLMDRAKELAKKATGIPTDRIFMAATHTHSAPSVAGALNTPPDEKYIEFLIPRIAEGIRRAQANLVPAKIGWGIGELPEWAMSRRWITRSDKIKKDPFGEFTTRATMHPGFRNTDWEEESGPMDPAISVLAVKSQDDKPISLLAAYSIHYIGAPVLSADYFGAFANRIAELVGPGDPNRPFMGIMSNGTSGDAWVRDYSLEKGRKFDRFSFADWVAQVAFKQYQSMQFHDWVPLEMREEKLELEVRKPKLEWAKKVLDELGDKPRKTKTHIYAGEQVHLSKMPPTREMKLQAIRIGTLGIVGIPAEVFAITGLSIRRQSHLRPTFTISLANGWDGYLPPPEQMSMGGYTTWLARSSCLEADAEPKVVAKVMELLDAVAGDGRAPKVEPHAPPYAKAVLASKPSAYWRLGEFNGPAATDCVSGKPLGEFETQIAYYMPGPRPPYFPGFEPDNRAPHFVGERLKAELPKLGDKYTVEMWCYNAMPIDVRPVTGYMLSRGPAGANGAAGEHLGIGGTESGSGKLFFHAGDDLKTAIVGRTPIDLRTWERGKCWHQVVLVRDGELVAVYLDGNPTPEITGSLKPTAGATFFLGGRNDGFSNFEGKLDEVSVYDRPLTSGEVVAHWHAAKP